MYRPPKARKEKLPYEINWQMRELFSGSALASFCNEIDSKYTSIEENKHHLN